MDAAIKGHERVCDVEDLMLQQVEAYAKADTIAIEGEEEDMSYYQGYCNGLIAALNLLTDNNYESV